jgi:hypothetical protein
MTLVIPKFDRIEVKETSLEGYNTLLLQLSMNQKKEAVSKNSLFFLSVPNVSIRNNFCNFIPDNQ